MWTRNNDVSNRNMLKHFIYSSSSKSTTSLLCSLYYRYSSELSFSFCILSFLVIATSIDQTFYSATHYLAAVWLNSRHDFNNNWFTKKINDMLMSVRDEKIFSEKVDLSMKVMITSDLKICNLLITSIYWNNFITSTMSLSN